MAQPTQHKSGKDSKHMQPSTQAKNGGAAPAKAAAPAPAVTSKGAEAARVFAPEDGSGTAAKPEAAAEAAAEAAVPQLSPDEKRRLFEAVIQAEQGIRAAEQAVKDARAACSLRVKEVIAAMGGKHGPWRYKGELLRARVRNDLAYFLRPDDLDVEDI